MEDTWANNLLLMQGKFSQASAEVSRVRRRPNAFYRLAWAARQEVLAAIHTAYLKDEKTVTVVSQNDLPETTCQATVLDTVLGFHTQQLKRRGLQASHISAATDCLDYGFCCGRFLLWPNRPAPYNIDYHVFSPDEVFLDWERNAEEGRFAIIEHCLSRDEFNEYALAFDFQNIERVPTTGSTSSALRDIRMGWTGPPIRPSESNKQYSFWECYLKLSLGGLPGIFLFFLPKDGDTLLAGPIPIKLPRLPFVIGQTILVPNVLVGESLAAVVRDPQETFNELMNCRIDNINLALRPIRVIQRGVGIDKYELAHAGAGDLSDIDAGNLQESITTLTTPDVTQGAFQEAQGAADLIRSLAGLPDHMTGTSGTPEGVVSQIYQAAAKKIDFVIGTFAQTYWHPWHELLLELLVGYDDDNVFNVAIQSAVVSKLPNLKQIPDVRRNVDLNCAIVLAHAEKQLTSDLEVYTALVREAAAANQQTMGMIQSGAQKPEGAAVFDTTRLLAFVLDRAGFRAIGDFLSPLPPPPSPPPPQPMIGEQQVQQTTQGQFLDPAGMMQQQTTKVVTKIPIVTSGAGATGGTPPPGGSQSPPPNVNPTPPAPPPPPPSPPLPSGGQA